MHNTLSSTLHKEQRLNKIKKLNHKFKNLHNLINN
jgi:hypothetical protein